MDQGHKDELSNENEDTFKDIEAFRSLQESEMYSGPKTVKESESNDKITGEDGIKAMETDGPSLYTNEVVNFGEDKVDHDADLDDCFKDHLGKYTCHFVEHILKAS